MPILNYTVIWCLVLSSSFSVAGMKLYLFSRTLPFLSHCLLLRYAIYLNKNINNKQHYKSTHGYLGLLAILAYIFIGIFGAVTLNPDFGVLKSNKTIRAAHKYAGKISTAFMWYVLATGKISLILSPNSLTNSSISFRCIQDGDGGLEAGCYPRSSPPHQCLHSPLSLERYNNFKY